MSVINVFEERKKERKKERERGGGGRDSLINQKVLVGVHKKLGEQSEKGKA